MNESRDINMNLNDSAISGGEGAVQAYKQRIAELYDKISASFSKIDTNKNGTIDETEFFNFLEQNTPQGKQVNKILFRSMFKDLDKNNDGVVSM